MIERAVRIHPLINYSYAVIILRFSAEENILNWKELLCINSRLFAHCTDLLHSVWTDNSQETLHIYSSSDERNSVSPKLSHINRKEYKMIEDHVTGLRSLLADDLEEVSVIHNS